MLRYASGPSRAALRLLVLHDDPGREFEYTAGAETSLERAGAEGWTVLSIKRDWQTVFANQSTSQPKLAKPQVFLHTCLAPAGVGIVARDIAEPPRTSRWWTGDPSSRGESAGVLAVAVFDREPVS
jgi:hypothetical protein